MPRSGREIFKAPLKPLERPFPFSMKRPGQTFNRQFVSGKNRSTFKSDGSRRDGK